MDLNHELEKAMKKAVLGVCAFLCAASASMPVFAGGTPEVSKEGPWLVRLRALHMKVDNGNSPDVALEADDKNFPEIDFSYFFTPRIAAELILTYPQKHDMRLGGSDIGSIKHLPPTLLLQYHFRPDQRFRPYVGAGLNYTRFTDVDIDVPGVRIDRNSFGLAVQAGVDYKLSKHWYFNVDVKYVDIDTDVRLNGTRLTTLKVDPMLYSVGVGYRF
jgi:outer membrane protein